MGVGGVQNILIKLIKIETGRYFNKKLTHIAGDR